MSRSGVVVVGAAPLWVLACGGGSLGTMGSGPSDGSGESSPGDAAPVPPDVSAGACNDLPDPRQEVQVQVVGGVAPTPTGGMVVDDLYGLESAVVFEPGTDGGISIEGRAHTISISGRQWASASYYDNARTTRYDDEATLSGTSVTLRRVCGNTSSGVLFGSQGTYSASDSTVVLNFPAGPAFATGATGVLTFVRAPDLDAGAGVDAGACIGTPCSNSYACCPGDAGWPPFGIACGASGTCEACNTNGLNDPCLGRPPSSPQGPDCCPGLACVNNRCVHP